MNPELLHEARQLLARASVLSEVASSPPSLGRSSHSKPDGSRPKGSGWGVFDELAVAVRACSSDRELERFVNSARLELLRWTRSAQAASAETPRQFKARIIRVYEGVHCDDVKVRENLGNATYIRQIRSDAGRDPLKGRVPSG